MNRVDHRQTQKSRKPTILSDDPINFTAQSDAFAHMPRKAVFRASRARLVENQQGHIPYCPRALRRGRMN